MALQQLRSSTANKRPTAAAMSDGQLAVNTNATNPGLFFKDADGSVRKVGPVFIGSSAPNSSPATGGSTGHAVGEQWLDNTGGVYVLKIWDGTAWRSESGTFVDVSGDTMTGDLVMNNANLVFEGATADDFETTLTVTDPTADRTITLPNVSGTVVTTGDTGTVTSAMIVDGTIVNADVNASAAIAGTKISPNFGSQNVITTGKIEVGTVIDLNADGSATFGVFPNRLNINAGYLLQYSSQAQANLVLRKTDSLRNSDRVLEVQNNTAAVTAEINADGSATFQAGVDVRTQDGQRGFTINSSSSSQNQALKINNNVGSQVTLLNHDGTATFAGAVAAGQGQFSTTGGWLPTVDNSYGTQVINGQITLKRPLAEGASNAKAEALIVSAGSVTAGNKKVLIYTDGSASFAGNINSGGSWGSDTNALLLATTGIGISSTTGTTAFNVYNGSYSSRTVAINFDGSAAFAGRIAAGSNDNGISNVTTNYALTAYNNSSTNSTIWARNNATNGNNFVGVNPAGSFTTIITNSGAATFAGTVKSTKVSSGANDVLFLGQSDIGQSAGTLVDKFKVKTDGSATFAGGIFSDFVSTTTSSGSFNFFKNAGVSGALNTAFGTTAGTQTIQFYNSGAATFGNFNTSSGTTHGISLDSFSSSHSGVRVQSTNTATTVGEFFAGYRGSTAVFQVTTGGSATFAGAVSKGSGSFRIDHPLKPETHQLVHSFVEGPQADNIYRGKVELVDGTATVNIDTVAGMTEGTFAALNRDIQCFTTNETGWTAIKGSVTDNLLTIVAQDNTCTDTISWLVIGERQDQHMYDTEWTDENGKVIVEPEKQVEEAEEAE